MGLIETVIKIGAGVVVGFTVAGSCAGPDTGNLDYALIQEEGKVRLYNSEIDKSYPLSMIGEKVYLGNSDHNLEGFKLLTAEQAKQQFSKLYKE